MSEQEESFAVLFTQSEVKEKWKWLYSTWGYVLGDNQLYMEASFLQFWIHSGDLCGG